MHASWLRNVLNALTFSPFAIGYLKRRQKAYEVEQEAIEGWNEKNFLRQLENSRFKKERVWIDGLSLMGKYTKILSYS